MQAQLKMRSTMAQRAPLAVARRPVMVVRAQADKPEAEQVSWQQRMALPLASMVAAAMMASAMVPDEAMAASRSGGRMGGSSGFSSRRAAPAAPSRSVQTQSSTTNIIVAPSPMMGFSPFGFSPFGGMGMGYGMGGGFGMPFGFFGPLLSFAALLLVANVVVGVVKGAMNASNTEKKNKDDQWGDL